jgi:hypothetical protein
MRKPTKRSQPYKKGAMARQPGLALRMMQAGKAQGHGPLGSFRQRMQRKTARR